MSSNPPSGWTDWTVTRLRNELKNLGRPVYGTKNTLQTRYLDAIADPYNQRQTPIAPRSKSPHMRYNTNHPDQSIAAGASPPENALLSHPGNAPSVPQQLTSAFEGPITPRRALATGATRRLRRTEQLSPEPTAEDQSLRSLMEAQREAALASKRADDIRSLEILLRLEQSLVGDDRITLDRGKRVQEMIDDILNS